MNGSAAKPLPFSGLESLVADAPTASTFLAVLVLLCTGLASSYYAFDIPSATETALQSAFLGSGGGSDTCINGTNYPAADNAAADAFNNNFNLLYSVYAWPNVVLPFFGGYLADRMGVRLMGVVFQAFLFVGQVLTALGASYIKVNANAAWYTMFVGRTFFGFGGESLSVVQSAMIASFFQGKELAFALGVNVALARVGSVLNNEISAVIASNAPVALAYWVGVAIIGAGLISMVSVFYVDLRAENALRSSRGLKPLVGRGLLPSLAGLLCGCCKRKAAARGRGGKAGGAAVAADGSANRLLSDADLDRPSTRSMDEAEADGGDGMLAEDLGIGGHGPLLPATPMLGRAHAPGAPGHGPGETGKRGGGGSVAGPGSVAGDLATADDGSGEEIHLSAVLKFPVVFWVLTLSCVTVYIDVLAFNNNASTFITQKFLATAPLWRVCDDVKNGWYLTANTIQSTVYACGAIITPFIGGFTDTFGMRAALNVVAAGAITGVHSVLAFTNFYPALPLVFLGMAYSLYAAALWPCIALVIEAKNQATAYGFVTAVQNLGQAIAPLGIAALMPDARCPDFDACVGSWNNVERLFVYIGAAGVACGFALNFVDGCVSKHPLLNESRKAMMKRTAEEEAKAIEAADTPLLLAA